MRLELSDLEGHRVSRGSVDIGGIADQQVEGSAVDGFEKVAREEPYAPIQVVTPEVLGCQSEGRRRDIAGKETPRMPFESEGRRDAPGSRADVEDPSELGERKVQRSLDQMLGLGARNEAS